jgi:hypothetical protein
LKSKFDDLKSLYDKSEEFVNFLKQAANVAVLPLLPRM